MNPFKFFLMLRWLFTREKTRDGAAIKRVLLRILAGAFLASAAFLWYELPFRPEPVMYSEPGVLRENGPEDGNSGEYFLVAWFGLPGLLLLVGSFWVRDPEIEEESDPRDKMDLKRFLNEYR